MTIQSDKLNKFAALLKQHTPKEGVQETCIKNFGVARVSSTHTKLSALYEPGIYMVAQGKKRCQVGDKLYVYGAGDFLALFLPMPADVEVLDASPDKPFLTAGLKIDADRLADVLLRIERAGGVAFKPVSDDVSNIFSAPLKDSLLDPVIRLLETLSNPTDANVLGSLIVDEIYYRVLLDERGGDLRILLQQRGEIQRVSKAVAYIHQNLNKSVSVEALAEMVFMSRTSFFETFKDVMHLSPLQYAKSVKLLEAQKLLKAGKNVSEASYLVGYNSSTQFSREYKRHFGFAPSAT